MNTSKLSRAVTLFALAAGCLAGRVLAGVSVYTYQYDNSRAGANTNETILTLANVNSNTFGRLFSYPVDGYVYAQPLVAAGVSIPGKGVHNVVYIATEHDTVYAFDADNFVSAPYWTNTFINLPNTNTIQTSTDSPNNNIRPEIGITGTPVIDPVSQTIFVEARTRESTAGGVVYYHRLHALDLATGRERSNSPVVIAATNYPGNGGPAGVVNGVFVSDTDGAGHVLWNSLQEQNRPGLLLVNGQVYLSYAEPGDVVPWHGWLFAYNAVTLAQTAVLCLTPNGGAGGIWMGGGAPAADTNGFIFANTGNGDFDVASGNFSDAYLKFSTSNGLQVADYFAPNNQAYLQSHDLDISSAGLLLLPDSAGSPAHRHLLLGGSKNNVVFLLDRDNLGHFNSTNDNQIVQGMTNLLNSQIYGAPAYFNGQVYLDSIIDVVKSFTIANASVNTTPAGVSSVSSTRGMNLTISANGCQNGIVWALNVDGYSSGASAVLHALDATNLAQELYRSDLVPNRDPGPPAIRFTTPVVANGKVFVPGRNAVTVFGNASFFPILVAGHLSNGVFTQPFNASPFTIYFLQASTNLIDWVSVSSNRPLSNLFNLNDPGASNFPYRFYRAVNP